MPALPVAIPDSITGETPAHQYRWQLFSRQENQVVWQGDSYAELIAQRDRRCAGRDDCRAKGISVRQNPALEKFTFAELAEAMKA